MQAALGMRAPDMGHHAGVAWDKLIGTAGAALGILGVIAGAIAGLWRANVQRAVEERMTADRIARHETFEETLAQVTAIRDQTDGIKESFITHTAADEENFERVAAQILDMRTEQGDTCKQILQELRDLRDREIRELRERMVRVETKQENVLRPRPPR